MKLDRWGSPELPNQVTGRPLETSGFLHRDVELMASDSTMPRPVWEQAEAKP